MLQIREPMLPIVLLLIGALTAWGAWGFVLVRFDPLVDGFIVHGLFYLSLALALIGTLTLLGLRIHTWRTGRMASRSEMGQIVRQGALVTFFVVMILTLAAWRLLRWWNIVPLALLTFTVELFFSSLHKRHNITYVTK